LSASEKGKQADSVASQEEVDGLVLFLEQRGPGCGYVLSGGRVLIVKVVSFEPYTQTGQTPHDEAVLREAVKQKKLKKGKLSDLATFPLLDRKLSDEDCYVLAHGS